MGLIEGEIVDGRKREGLADISAFLKCLAGKYPEQVDRLLKMVKIVESKASQNTINLQF